MKKLGIFVMPLIAISLLASCGGGGDDPGPEPEPDPIETPLNFKCVSDKATLTIIVGDKFNEDEEFSLECSKDGVNWEEVKIFPYREISAALFSLTKSEIIYFRDDMLNKEPFYQFAGRISIEGEPIKDGDLVVSGNIMSLLQKNNFATLTDLSPSAFHGLFESNKNLVDASNLLLPSTTLVNCCYTSMFSYCTSLTTAPKLPATTLAKGCYMNMFNVCSSLTTAPELPASTLMEDCYACMFNSCSKLNHIKVGFGVAGKSDWPTAEDCTESWLTGVADSGVFEWRGNDGVGLTRSNDTIPEGWTIKIY